MKTSKPLESMPASRIAALLKGSEIDYRKCSTERTRHLRVERVRSSEEVGPWCVAKTGNPDAPAIYTSKAGIVCVSVETVDMHGSRVLKGSHNEHRTLHVERINFR